ncbi:PHD finger protein 23A-like isoform X3 [Tenebrio molitor]|uniref:PHD finger protein 23A-like isoform X3 n=1 Tax=Tenebrio molitor TaxID=7067 RepID=UPI0036246EA8
MTNKELSLPSAIMEQKNSVTEVAGMSNGYRRPRTSADFYDFCTMVLQYANYEGWKKDELRNETNQSPPLDSSGSSVNSESTSSGQKDKQSEDDEDSDSFNLVTCFCGKPFAGRPMIECLECLTWIHLSCARIKKNNIPECDMNTENDV